MVKQVIPTLSNTGMGQGSNEAALLLRSKEGRNHQGQVSPRHQLKVEYMSATCSSLHRRFALQNGMGPYMSHKQLGARYKPMNCLCETTANRLIDMKFIKLRSLLRQGEGQDEGIYKNSNLPLLDSLTPALSQREREFVGQQ